VPISERYLVTGCAGFIGSHITRRLLADGCDVVGVDDLSTGRLANIEDIRPQFRFLQGSLCDRAIADQACAGVTRVLHQASIPSVPRSLDDPLASLHSSITATVTLLLAARDAGVERVVQAASSSAYGDTEVLPKVESMLPHPLSPYAAAKVSQEHYATAFARCFGLDTVSLRYFNVFGPRQDPKSQYAAVIPRFITAMLRDERPVIHGDGLQSRDFTYVDNVVEGNLLAARAPTPLRGEVINLACGDRVTLLGLVAQLNRLLHKNIAPVHGDPRPGDVRHSQAGIEKAQTLLAFQPVVPFAEGLRRTVAYFQSLTR